MISKGNDTNWPKSYRSQIALKNLSLCSKSLSMNPHKLGNLGSAMATVMEFGIALKFLARYGDLSLERLISWNRN